MRLLKNWDNNTWLSSKKYITNFHKFLNKNISFNKNTKILDIGCGRANIISYLQSRYKFEYKATGIDVVKNNKLKKNIIFKKTDAIKYLKKNKQRYDFILIKQTIHFFSKKKLLYLLNLVKKNLNQNGLLLILSLKTNNNKIPCFKKMKNELNSSLKKDEFLLKIIRKNLREVKESNFNFKVVISKKKYINMIKTRYISCLLNLSKQELNYGIDEIKLKLKNPIKFTDTLKCLSYRK